MKPRAIHSILMVGLAATAAHSAALEVDRGAGRASAAEGALELVITEAGTSGTHPMPARVHLRDVGGQPVIPPGFPSWRDHFVCDGRAKITLPWGQYRIEVERGPEYARWTETIELSEASPAQSRSIALARIAHMASEGWWSGDLHVHRSLNDAELLMRAEDLHVAQFTTWWNETNPWKTASLPAEAPVRFDGDRFYHPLAGEDERDGGALLYFNLEKPLDITGSGRHHPSSVVFAREAESRPGAWVEIEKPFWWDFPLWLANGIGASIGVAQNHLHRGGVLDNEAWGRPRDRTRYPGPRGNGLYTQDLYFHALNCAFWLPPSAGSASGVLPNPAGYNRVYVQVEGDLTWDKWWAGLRARRVFVSNGPLLRATANGHLPGHRFESKGPLEIRLDARIDSREPIESVELIRNGHAETISLPSVVTFDQSGWFLIRATANVSHTLRFAMTAPWQVEIDGRPVPVQEQSAQFFLDWTRERLATLEALTGLDARQKREVTEPWRHAEAFWREQLAQSTLPNHRRPENDAALEYWLDNMLRHHRFSRPEVRLATGLNAAQVDEAVRRFHLSNAPVPVRDSKEPLRVLPYPGGRHPRLGFFEGAIAPQRETKISVFTPWDATAYVVADIPEAIWSNLGLTYLAHTHIETLWTRQGVTLPPLEWNRREDGTLDFERVLPNGIAFGTKVVPTSPAVLMETWLRNGSPEPLSQLRLQNCLMLGRAPEFAEQTETNKVFRGPYAACRSSAGARWVITAWMPVDGTWQNPPLPCIHSNGRLADCPPGATVKARGWLSFHEGENLDAELDRIDRLRWWE